MSNKVSVGAELSPGLYRILNPEINTLGYVAKSGGEPVTPVTLALSQPTDLNELVSSSLSRLVDQTGAYV